jgi:iron complex outermembrane receptor protein
VVGLVLAVVLVGLFPNTRLVAQELPDSVVPLDSVLVTVTRGLDGLGHTPFAVSVQGEANLQLGNTGYSLEEALQGLPGVQVQNRYNYTVGERISIRGAGARAQFGVRGLKVLVDGIPATMADGQSTLDHLDLGSLGRAEVLRGPASAIYGNGGGGVLSFETVRPPDVPIRQEAKSVFGGDGLVRLQSTTSGTLDGTTYLVNLARLSYDGFRDHPDDPSTLFGGADRFNANAQVRTELAGGALQITGNFFDLDGENAGQLNQSDFEAGVRTARGFNVNQGTRKDVHQGQIGATWSGPVSSVQAQFSGWGLFRDMDNPIPPSVIDLERTAFGARAAVTTQTPGESGDLTWTAGIDLDLQRDNRLNFENESGARGALILDQRETVSATGLFVQLRAPLSARAWVMGGLRYDRFRFEADDHFITAESPDESGVRTMDALSPTVGVHFEVTPELILYGNVATSLDTPSTTELVNRPDGGGGFNPELDPQRGVSGEVGVRGQVQSRVSYEASIFVTESKDELVPFEDPAQDGRTFFRNSGESKYQGFEGSLRVVLPAQLQAQLTYTYISATFTDYVVDGDVFDGNDVPGLARHRLDGFVRVTNGPWFGELRGDYVGRMAVNDENDERTKSYSLWEARTGLATFRLGRLEVSPFAGVANLFDKSYAAAVAVNAFGGRYYEPGPGRAFFAGVSAAF